MILTVVLLLQVYAHPHESKTRNKLETFYSVFTLFLASSCVFFIREIRDHTIKRLNAQDIFIYGFILLMAVSIGHILLESIADCYQKCKEKRKNKSNKVHVQKEENSERESPSKQVSKKKLTMLTDNSLKRYSSNNQSMLDVK